MKKSFVSAAIFAAGLMLTSAGALADQFKFEDVVRNLRNPDAKIRLESLRLLREARYPEAIGPIAPLVNDPLDVIQLEAIAAELSFFLIDEVPGKKRVALVIEVRNRGGAPGAFDLGPLAVWPRPAPPELVDSLLTAVDDENPRVRLEAIYAVGVVANAPLTAEAEARLVKALDHYDPAVREAAARVAGRIGAKRAADALVRAVNDSNAQVRFAAMRALGDLRETRAVQALTEQMNYYVKGEGAWSALEALAKIAHPSSVPVFKARLADKDPFARRAAAEGLGRAGEASATSDLETGAGNDPSEMVRAAMAFALQKLGRNYVARLVDFMDDRKMVPQIQAYLIELGPPIEKELIPRLQELDELVRANVAEVLGEIGGDASLHALQALQDRDRNVVEAAKRAAERIKMRQG